MKRTCPNRQCEVIRYALLAIVLLVASEVAAGEAMPSGGVMIKGLGTLYPIRSERGEVFLVGPVPVEKLDGFDASNCEAKLCGEAVGMDGIVSVSLTGLEMRAYSNTGLIFLRMAKSSQIRPMPLRFVEEPRSAWNIASVIESTVMTKRNPDGNGWISQRMPWLFIGTVADAGRSVAADGSAIRLHLASVISDGVLLSKDGGCLGLVIGRLSNGHVTFALPARQIARMLAGVIDMATVGGYTTSTGGSLQAQVLLCDPERRIAAVQLQVLDVASQKVLADAKAVVAGQPAPPLRFNAEWFGGGSQGMRLVTIYKDGRSDPSPTMPIPAGTFAFRMVGASDGKPEAIDPLLTIQQEELGRCQVIHVYGGRVLLESTVQDKRTHALEVRDAKTWQTIATAEIGHFECAAGPNVLCYDAEWKAMALGMDLKKIRDVAGGVQRLQPLNDTGIVVQPNHRNPKTKAMGLMALDLATGRIIAESPLEDVEVIGRFAGSDRMLLRTTMGNPRRLRCAELNRGRTGWDVVALDGLVSDQWKPLVGNTLIGEFGQPTQRLYVMGAKGAIPFYGKQVFPQPDGRLAALDHAGYLWDIDPQDGTPLAPPLAWLPAGPKGRERTVYFVDLRTRLVATITDRFHTLHRLPLVAGLANTALRR